MPHGFFSPVITQNGIVPLALNRSTAQGHEHRLFFFCGLGFIFCPWFVRFLAYSSLRVRCLLDLLHRQLSPIWLRSEPVSSLPHGQTSQCTSASQRPIGRKIGPVVCPASSSPERNFS